MNEHSNTNNKIYTNIGNWNLIQHILPTMRYVLDVGCGAGDNSKILYEQGKIVDGITLSPEEAKLATPYQRHVAIFNLEQGLPPEFKENRYDAIVCSHVIEHICYPKALLNDIRTCLEPNHGILLVALPNIMHYRYRLQLLKGNFEYEEQGIMDYTHFRWYTFKSGRKLLENHGFKVQKAWVNIGEPKSKLIRALPDWTKNALRQTMLATSEGLFGYELMYLASL